MLHKDYMTDEDRAELAAIEALRAESALRWRRLLGRLRQRAFRDKAK